MNRRERRAHGAYPRRFRSVRTSPRGFRLMFPGLTAPVDYNGSPIKPGQAELSMWRLRRDLDRARAEYETLRDHASAILFEDPRASDAFARMFVVQPAA